MEQGIHLKQAREAQRMSQTHLAKAAGISKRTVIRAEQGHEIQDETLRCLCSVLGIDATKVPPRAVSEPFTVTPRSILHGVVERNGETILWEGTADAPAWRREIGLDTLYLAYAGLVVAGLAACALYAYVAYDQSRQGLAMDETALWAGVAGAFLTVLALRRVLTGISGINRSHLRVRTSLFAMTDAAFYTARATGWHDKHVASVERVELPECREECRVRPRSPLWPVARSIRLPVHDREGSRILHVEGIPDLESLASLMRGEPMKAAA